VHGCRDLQPHHYLPAACPYVQAGIGTSGNLPQKSTALSSTPSSSNPNFDEVLSIRTSLPVNEMFAPTLTVEVFDSRFGGLYKPLLGSCEIETGEHLPWNKRARQADAGSMDKLLAALNPMDPEHVSAGAGAFGTFESELARHNSLAMAPMRGSAGGLAGGGGAGGAGGSGSAGAFTFVDPWKIGRDHTTDQLEELMKKTGSTTFHAWHLERYSEFGADSGGPSMQRTKQSGILKGFIRIKEHTAATLPLEWPIKMEELTAPQSVVVRLYVLEAKGLAESDALSKPDPFLKVTLGESYEQSTQSRYMTDSNDPYFGEVFEFQSTMPGDTMLKIEVMDHDTFRCDLIGTTTIDLEQRFFNKEWRQLGRQHPTGQVIKRPVEQRPLLLPGKDPQGTIVCWCDIFTKEQARFNPPVNVAKPLPEEFELRVVVWNANNLKLMDGSGLNDVQFTVTLSGHDPVANSFVEETLETDTHWRASGGEASMNYRLVFKLMLPMKPRAKLIIKAWDRDPLEFRSELIGRWEHDLNGSSGGRSGVLDEALFKYRRHMQFLAGVESMTSTEQVKSELRKANITFHEDHSVQGNPQYLSDLKDLLLTFGTEGLPGTAVRFPRGAGGGSGFSAGGAQNKITLTPTQARERTEQGRGFGDGDAYKANLSHPNAPGEDRGTVEMQFEVLPKDLAGKRPVGQGRDKPNQFPTLVRMPLPLFSSPC
jgi:hypothetical protein